MKEQIRVVRTVIRNPGLFRIAIAYFWFAMAEFATWVAMLVYGYQRGGASAAGAVAAIQLIPCGVIAPFVGFMGDRFRRDRVLFASYLVQGLTFGLAAVALAADASFVVVMMFASIAASSLVITRPTQAALLPSVSHGPEELTAANAVSMFAGSAGIVVGPLVAGILLARWGPSQVFAVFAIVMVIAGLLVARLDISSGDAAPSVTIGAMNVVRASLGGFRFLRAERRASLIVLVLSGGIVLSGALDVLFVAVAISALGKGQSWAGFLSSASGFGALVGAAFAVALIGRRRLVPALAGGTFVFSGPVAMIGAAPAASTAPALFAVAGAGGSVAWVAGTTLLQRIAPDVMLARVFGVLEGLRAFALAIGSLGASALIAALGVRLALVAIAALAPVVMLALWIPLSSIDREARAPDPALVAFVRRVSIFSPLPPPAIERIVAHLERIELAAGQLLIREGDVGDRFVLIGSGEAEVTRDGTYFTTLKTGDYVGEIALLRDVPRTATVTAMAPMELLTLDRATFLEAVTGYPRSRERAEAIVEARLAIEPVNGHEPPTTR
ncbi:MAG: MFS transporter [Actinomycetota bacterium]